MPDKISHKVIILIAILLNITALFSLFTRETDIDEGMIAAHAYYLNEVGYVKSPHFHNTGFEWEERQYHYHKLTVWTGALVSKAFGFHLFSFRLISYAFYLIFLLTLYHYFKLKKLPLISFWLFQIVFLINSTAFKFGFIYRPEIVLMSLGFLSYYLLELNKNKPSTIYLATSAISAGLASLMHLNGLIFIFAGAVSLFIMRDYMKGIIYGAIGGTTTLLYFADTLSKETFLNWKEHFFADPNLIGKKASPFLKIFDEHMRFFHSEREIIFSVLLIVSWILVAKPIRQKLSGMLWYFVSLVLSLALIAHGATTKYMLLYMPYMVIIVTTALMNFSEFKKYQKPVFLLFLSIFIGYHSFVNYKTLLRSNNTVERHKMLAERVPEKNTLIFANEGFVFNQISNFDIQSPCAFNFHYSTFHPGEKPTIGKLFDFLLEGKTKYVLIDQKVEISEIYHQIPYDQLTIGDPYYSYRVIDKGSDFILFELNIAN